MVDSEIKIKPILKSISTLGEINIDFSPEYVAVPYDWRKLWDLSEREKLSLKDREVFEEELLKILDVKFI